MGGFVGQDGNIEVGNDLNNMKSILLLETIDDINDTQNFQLNYSGFYYYDYYQQYYSLTPLLLEYNKNTIGISIYDIRDNNNNIALHYAIKYKNKIFIEELLKYESNTLFADNTGNNSFHLSILSRDIDIVKLILKYSEKTIIIKHVE